MAENKQGLLHVAAFNGFILGIFWIFKYLFFMFGTNSAFMSSIYWVLTPLTLVITYYMINMYRWAKGGKITFFHAWQMGILLYFFAGLLVAPVHYIFYRYLAPANFLSNAFEMTIQALKTMNANPELMESIENMNIPTPIGMTIQQLFNNVFYGVIFSIPIAMILVSRKKTDGYRPESDNEQENPE